MTIGIAWLRKGIESQELLLASDSRLSGDGHIWDDCPKLFCLPRRDAAIGFSGSTGQAYPLLLQLANAISSYRAAADGTLEFFHLAGHLERVANSMMDRLIVDPAISGDQNTHREFATTGDTLILGGYSRVRGGMVILDLRYRAVPGKWHFGRARPIRALGPGRIIKTFGDRLSQSRYRHLLELILQSRGLLRSTQPFDLEPLEALADFLELAESPARPLPRNNRPASIGGSPQIIRIIPGAQATPFAVRWTVAGSAKVYLQGRLTFDYENLDVPLISFESSGPRIHAPGQWSTSNEN